MNRPILRFIVFLLILATTSVRAAVVFSNDFDDILPAEITPGDATLTPVQDYAGLGPVGNQFGGLFLRSETGKTVTLTLTNLPPHNVLHLSMLFAAIDSLDGTGTFPSGDFFAVTLDGNIVFHESFANADSSQIQSYEPPPGAQLARHVDLGFNGPGGFYTDSAYNFGLDFRFSNLAHTNSVAVFTFIIEGEGIQSLDDESWAMDNLTVSTTPLLTPNITRILSVDTNMMITWLAVSNATYRVQSKTNLSDAIWNDLMPLVIATNSTADYSEPRNSGNTFYRVTLLP